MTTTESRTHGFCAGYFIIRSSSTGRLWDVQGDFVEDGTEIVLWSAKDFSIVEGLRDPDSNNQVFFIDTSGALCSRSSGHAIDIEDDRLVLRHRRPVSYPYPNAYSHPLPQFSYDQRSGEISVQFSTDPSYPSTSGPTSNAWKANHFVLAAIPKPKPRTLVDNATTFISSAVTAPFNFFTGASSPTKATFDAVENNDIDLKEDEVLDQDRGEDLELDDSPDRMRKLRMITVEDDKVIADLVLCDKARKRRQWDIVPLRRAIARTAGV